MIRLYPEFNMNTTLHPFISRLNIINLSTTNIEQYFQTKYEVLHFDTIIRNSDKCYVDNDIPGKTTSYEIVNNRVYKIDNPCNYQKYQFSNELVFHSHKEADIVRKEIHTIPLGLSYVKKEFRKYKLHSNSLVTLLIENNTHTSGFSKPNDPPKIVFLINETEITESIKEEMITFLSLLKLYK